VRYFAGFAAGNGLPPLFSQIRAYWILGTIYIEFDAIRRSGNGTIADTLDPTQGCRDYLSYIGLRALSMCDQQPLGIPAEHLLPHYCGH